MLDNVPTWVLLLPQSSANPISTRAKIHPAHASAARCAAGLRVSMIAGSASAAMSGTPSIREGSARRAFTNGTKPSASRVVAGHPTRIGIPIREFRRAHEYCCPSDLLHWSCSRA